MRLELLLYTTLFGILANCNGIDPEPALVPLEVVVIDHNDDFVRDASVTIYPTEEDFANNTNPIRILQKTNDLGKIIYDDFSNSFTECYVNVEKLDFNNWTGKKQFDLRTKPSRLIIQIRQSLASKVVGKTGKRWQQLSQTINGQVFQDCNNQQIHWFKPDFYKYIYSSPQCGGERLLSKEAWAENPNNRSKSLLLGDPSDPKTLKTIQMLEISDTKMKYYYLKSDKNGSVTVVDEFKAN